MSDSSLNDRVTDRQFDLIHGEQSRHASRLDAHESKLTKHEIRLGRLEAEWQSLKVALLSVALLGVIVVGVWAVSR